MTSDLKKEAREAIRPHVAKRAAAHEQVYGTAMTMTEEDACCADFRVGYLAAAEPREKEIASLRAKLEAVPVKEIRFLAQEARLKNLVGVATIDRWLAGLGKNNNKGDL